MAVNTIMKNKIIIISAALIIAVAGVIYAQEFGRPNSDIGQSMHREFFRNVKLNAARTETLNTIWDAIDAKKPNTTLNRVMLTRDGTNDVTINVHESIRVKMVED